MNYYVKMNDGDMMYVVIMTRLYNNYIISRINKV